MSNNGNADYWLAQLNNEDTRKHFAEFLAMCNLEDLTTPLQPKAIDEQQLIHNYKNKSVFMAFLHRQNSIQRWTKSQSVQPESLNDHTVSVANLALLLGAKHKLLNPESNFSPERLVVFAMFHDSKEAMSEDVNSLIKSKDSALKKKIKDVEETIGHKIASTIDPSLSPFVAPYFLMDCSTEESELVKAADLLSALAKAKCELRSNNADFVHAASGLIAELAYYMEKYEAVRFVYDVYMQAYDLTIDELMVFFPKN